ncbi:MAG: hypothetical protein NZ941_02765 [Candidatus Caldarchaeum sp.]|nr:hypothetical protein [Candidatus Caldarchaeum sp.]
MLPEGITAVDFAVKILVQNLNRVPFRDFFSRETVLVPVPPSTPLKEDSLWVPLEICKALEKKGLGITHKILYRKKPIPRSSRVDPQNRPLPHVHYDSLGYQVSFIEIRKILLVDDVVTRGHALLGSAWRVKEAYPKADVQGFALIRTISNPTEFKSLYDPEMGTITYRRKYRDALRRP